MWRKLTQAIRAIRWQHEIRQVVSSHLEILEHPDLFALGGLTDEEDGEVARLVSLATHGVIVELGTLFGITTQWIVLNKAPGQKVITVDNFSWNPFGLPPKLHEAFAERILRGALATGDVTLYKGPSASFRETCTDVPTLLFIDADHAYEAVKEEIRWAKGVGVGIIAGHDYGHPRFGVTRAVDEAFADREIHVVGSVWSVQFPTQAREGARGEGVSSA